MPKLGYSPLPQAEEAICLRIRQIREEARISQAEFGRRVGQSRERIASYEYARAPVRWALGDRVCREFNVNQRWLAEGKVPRYGYFQVANSPKIPSSALFSKGYNVVAPTILRAVDAAVHAFRCPVEALDGLDGDWAKISSINDLGPSLKKLLPELIAGDVKLIPDSLVSAYFQLIASRSLALRNDDFKELKSFIKEAKEIGRERTVNSRRNAKKGEAVKRALKAL